jgi:hypothetical protein
MSEEPATPRRAKKSTNAVVARRVEAVLRLRIDGATFADIREYAGNPTPPDTPWGVSDSQLWKYVAASDEMMKEQSKTKAGAYRRLSIGRRESLYARALQAGDYRTALAVLQDLSKLCDHYTDPKHLRLLAVQIQEITARLAALGPSSDPTEATLDGLTPEEKLRLARALRKRGYLTDRATDPDTGLPERDATVTVEDAG